MMMMMVFRRHNGTHKRCHATACHSTNCEREGEEDGAWRVGAREGERSLCAIGVPANRCNGASHVGAGNQRGGPSCAASHGARAHSSGTVRLGYIGDGRHGVSGRGERGGEGDWASEQPPGQNGTTSQTRTAQGLV